VRQNQFTHALFLPSSNNLATFLFFDNFGTRNDGKMGSSKVYIGNLDARVTERELEDGASLQTYCFRDVTRCLAVKRGRWIDVGDMCARLDSPTVFFLRELSELHEREAVLSSDAYALMTEEPQSWPYLLV
jgi:hypothetical protein